MKNTWWMTNVVYYDGSDAYVSKFVLKTTTELNEDGVECPKVTEESEGLLGQYLNGNGEILKVDLLYPVDLDNIIALKDWDDAPQETINEMKAAYDRFKEMWF